MRRILLALLLALALVTAMAPAEGGSTRAFKGKLAGEVTFVPAPSEMNCQYPTPDAPWVTVSTADGRVSGMGKVTMESLHCSGNDIEGLMTLDGRRGDVTLAYEGPCTPYVPGLTLVACDLDFTVVGATGRYAGATGGGDLLATVRPQPVPPWLARWTLRGRISY